MTTRTSLPQWVQDAPELFMGLEFTYNAFFDLTGDRPMGWGPGPIPYMSIRQYGVMNELENEDLEEFIYLIREMDQEFLRFHAEEAAKKK